MRKKLHSEGVGRKKNKRIKRRENLKMFLPIAFYSFVYSKEE